MTAMMEAPLSESAADFLWLDLTRKCQLSCTHCYNDSGPTGDHGTMERHAWLKVLDQAANCGVRQVQFIGGEPTLHPDFVDLVDHALLLGLGVEVYSNLVHVSDRCWSLFRREGVSLAASYYSDQADEHNAVTGRRSHFRTRANIEKAVRLGVALRVGIIAEEGSDVSAVRAEVEALGVARVSVDRIRPFGRGGQEQEPDAADLCGQCGTGKAAIGPTGEVSPCVFSGWMGVGNVQNAPLGAILAGSAMSEANASIRSVARRGGCEPDTECSPGFPGSSCSPRN